MSLSVVITWGSMYPSGKGHGTGFAFVILSRQYSLLMILHMQPLY